MQYLEGAKIPHPDLKAALQDLSTRLEQSLGDIRQEALDLGIQHQLKLLNTYVVLQWLERHFRSQIILAS